MSRLAYFEGGSLLRTAQKIILSISSSPEATHLIKRIKNSLGGFNLDLLHPCGP